MRTLIPWRRANGGPFNLMRREVDDMFRRFFAEPVEEMSGLTVHEWAPSVDVEESEKEVLVKADLPGVDPKDVEISVTEGALVLKGEKKRGKGGQEEELSSRRALRRQVLSRDPIARWRGRGEDHGRIDQGSDYHHDSQEAGIGGKEDRRQER